MWVIATVKLKCGFCIAPVVQVPFVYLHGSRDQELMNHHSEKERLTSVPILYRITLQNAPYKDYNLIVLTSLRLLL